jgi:hypothetical protein
VSWNGVPLEGVSWRFWVPKELRGHSDRDGTFVLDARAVAAWESTELVLEYGGFLRRRLSRRDPLPEVLEVALDPEKEGVRVITGSVEDGRGRPVAGATVGEMPPGHFARGTTDEQGRFRTVLGAGSTSVTAWSEGFFAQRVPLVEGSLEDVRIRLRADTFHGTLVLKVVDPSGQPAREVRGDIHVVADPQRALHEEPTSDDVRLTRTVALGLGIGDSSTEFVTDDQGSIRLQCRVPGVHVLAVAGAIGWGRARVEIRPPGDTPLTMRLRRGRPRVPRLAGGGRLA